MLLVNHALPISEIYSFSARDVTTPRPLSARNRPRLFGQRKHGPCPQSTCDISAAKVLQMRVKYNVCWVREVHIRIITCRVLYIDGDDCHVDGRRDVPDAAMQYPPVMRCQPIVITNAASRLVVNIQL